MKIQKINSLDSCNSCSKVINRSPLKEQTCIRTTTGPFSVVCLPDYGATLPQFTTPLFLNRRPLLEAWWGIVFRMQKYELFFNDYPHCTEEASERLNLNNPIQENLRFSQCGDWNQPHKCVSERRDFIFRTIADNHFFYSTRFCGGIIIHFLQTEYFFNMFAN